MCIFCGHETQENKNFEDTIIECKYCKSEIINIKSNNKMMVSKFPKGYKLTWLIVFFIPISILYWIIIAIFFKNNNLIKLFCIPYVCLGFLSIFIGGKNFYNYFSKGFIIDRSQVLTRESRTNDKLFSFINAGMMIFCGILISIVMLYFIIK